MQSLKNSSDQPARNQRTQHGKTEQQKFVPEKKNQSKLNCIKPEMKEKEINLRKHEAARTLHRGGTFSRDLSKTLSLSPSTPVDWHREECSD